MHLDKSIWNKIETVRKTFRKLIRTNPFVVADLYAQPDDDDICEPLVRALEDQDRVIRKAAVEALVDLNDLHAASQIFWMVSRGSRHARRAAAEILGRLSDPLCIHSLMGALHDPDRAVRATAVEGLAANIRNGNPADFPKSAAELIALHLLADKKRVRNAASKVLLKIGIRTTDHRHDRKK